ncbi:nickel transporter [Streptomyces sp. WZ.A104]|uniref:HoxN/HupN/NixA family nickel/cobalt transporter n=1 Tax=Streptomyces sp. WZ.A104 TaxID=2023771 RepID=UPI000BBB8684|nr:nickel transporter [Streptomyces sp. WZ.A104]PCG83902.1 nickel transporter [Streptomyces sp. WZ.A104]
MNHTLRRTVTTLAATAFAALACVAAAPHATAHPLGNFSVNHHTGLVLRPDRIDAHIVVDRAEIAALQERPTVDADRDGTISDGESRAYAEKTCSSLSGQLHLNVDGTAVDWSRSSAALEYQKGEAGLQTSRLTCRLSAPAELGAPAEIRAETDYDTRRVGWHEMTATGQGLSITRSDVPATSATRELRQYPEDPLASALDQRTAALNTEPGQGATLPAVADLPGAGVISAALAKVTGAFDALVGAREITLPVGLLALLLAIVLGASHAAMPGHGKTIMAAYLAGRRGTRRDALTVGATVTLTHTAGVLVLGLALPVSTHLAGESVLMWLGAASGLLVTGIGLWLLNGAVRGRPQHNHHHHGPHHGHSHSDGGHHHHHGPGHSHSHSHGDASHHHGHDHGPDGPHDHGPVASPTEPGTAPAADLRPDVRVATLAPPDHEHLPSSTSTPPKSTRRASRSGLVGMGIAGGLVPSPSALVVLLGAVALGRTAFGVLLVIGYGLGMAATLTLAGLLLVRLRERIESHDRTRTLRRNPLLRKLVRTGPVITALLVVCVGLGLTLRAATGNG